MAGSFALAFDAAFDIGEPMTTTAAVHTNDVQADGTQLVVYQFTHTESGYQWLSGTYYLGAGTNAVTFGATLTAGAEAAQKEAERERAYQIAITPEGDPDLETWNFNTLADIRKYVFRRLFNLMRDAVWDPQKCVVCADVSLPLGYLNKHNNASIAGFIDDPAWGTPDANNAKSKISAVGTNVRLLDHGEAELSLDF